MLILVALLHLTGGKTIVLNEKQCLVGTVGIHLQDTKLLETSAYFI